MKVKCLQGILETYAKESSQLISMQKWKKLFSKNVTDIIKLIYQSFCKWALILVHASILVFHLWLNATKNPSLIILIILCTGKPPARVVKHSHKYAHKHVMKFLNIINNKWHLTINNCYPIHEKLDDMILTFL